MQVKFRLDAVLAAAQFAQRRFGNTGAGEQRRIRRRQLRLIGGTVQDLLEHQAPVGTREAGAGSRLGRIPYHPRRLCQRRHIAGGLAKQRALVLIGLGLHFRSPEPSSQRLY